jgi:hypothetical protein
MQDYEKRNMEINKEAKKRREREAAKLAKIPPKPEVSSVVKELEVGDLVVYRLKSETDELRYVGSVLEKNSLDIVVYFLPYKSGRETALLNEEDHRERRSHLDNKGIWASHDAFTSQITRRVPYATIDYLLKVDLPDIYRENLLTRTDSKKRED